MPPASIADIIPSTKALREAAKRLHSALDKSFKSEKVKVSHSNLSCSPSEQELAASVKRYNEEIERHANDLQSLLAPLQNLLRCAKLEVTHNAALLSAQRRLPKILSRIFLLAAEKAPSRPSLEHLGDRHNFVRVCNTCHNVARSTPELWTRISVCDTETDEQHALFAKELELTGKRPLDVRLIHLKSKNKIIAPTKSWNLLKEESKRWRSLTLEINSHEFHVMTPSDERLDCQSLEALCLDHNILSPDPSYINPKYDLPHLLLPEISNATSLRTVQIKVESVGGGWKEKVCFLETWHLTDLSLCFEKCGDATRFLPILKQQACTLQRLNFAITKIWVPEDGKLGTHATSIPMHKLTELSCRLDATPLISCIKAPKLKSLTIDEHPGVLTDCIYNTVGAGDAKMSNDATKTDDAATGREISNATRITDAASREIKDAADTVKTSEALPSVADRIKTYIHLTSLSISNVEWPSKSLIPTLIEVDALKYLKLDESDGRYLGQLVTKTLLQNMRPNQCTLVSGREWTFLIQLEKLEITLSLEAEKDEELRKMVDSCVQSVNSRSRDPQTRRTTDLGGSGRRTLPRNGSRETYSRYHVCR
ncbi:hypothetical protein GGG16DRAFT_61396 [Schizophyllum commune]